MTHLQNFHEDDFIASGVCSNKSGMRDGIGHVLNGLCSCVMASICEERKGGRAVRRPRQPRVGRPLGAPHPVLSA